MGSVGAGLASIGGSIAEAREIQRQRQLEDIKLKMEQSRLATEQEQAEISRRYADIAGIREKRLSAQANQPTVSKWQLVGNTMIAAGQNPDGSPFVKSFEVNREVGLQLKSIQDEIAQAPADVQPILQSMAWEKINEGDIKGASNAINNVLQSYARSKLPGQETVTSGFQMAGPFTIPGYPYPVMVQVPTQTRTERMPAGTNTPALPPISSPFSPTSFPDQGAPQPAAPAFSGTPTAQGAAPPPGMNFPPGSRIIGPKPLSAADKKSGQMKPEIEMSMRALRAALWGRGDTPGLSSKLGVLDSFSSRMKMIAAGIGSTPIAGQGMISRMAQGAYSGSLTNEEQEFGAQLARAIGAINGLRGITGLPRSTQSLMDTYARELPNPINTPSKKFGQYKLQLIEREIQAAMNDAVTNEGKGAEAILGGTMANWPGIPAPVASPATDQPNAPQSAVPGQTSTPSDFDKRMDSIFGPKKK